MKEKWLMAEGSWQEIKPMITTALESGFDCVLVDRENIERVRELGKIKVACFGAQRGTEDILAIGKGGEGDGTVALPKDPGSSLDVLFFQPERMAFSPDLVANQFRGDVGSRFSSWLGRPWVETDVRVRQTIGRISATSNGK